MYSAILFEAKNRNKEVSNLITIFDGNMNAVLCTTYDGEITDVIKKNGFEFNAVRFPVGLVEVSVSEMRSIEKRVTDKMRGVLCE